MGAGGRILAMVYAILLVMISSESTNEDPILSQIAAISFPNPIDSLLQD